jgi:hypothetical protein
VLEHNALIKNTENYTAGDYPVLINIVKSDNFFSLENIAI